jgi:hypothetical protein
MLYPDRDQLRPRPVRTAVPMDYSSESIKPTVLPDTLYEQVVGRLQFALMKLGEATIYLITGLFAFIAVSAVYFAVVGHIGRHDIEEADVSFQFITVHDHEQAMIIMYNKSDAWHTQYVREMKALNHRQDQVAVYKVNCEATRPGGQDAEAPAAVPKANTGGFTFPEGACERAMASAYRYSHKSWEKRQEEHDEKLPVSFAVKDPTVRFTHRHAFWAWSCALHSSRCCWP